MAAEVDEVATGSGDDQVGFVAAGAVLAVGAQTGAHRDDARSVDGQRGVDAAPAPTVLVVAGELDSGQRTDERGLQALGRGVQRQVRRDAAVDLRTGRVQTETEGTQRPSGAAPLVLEEVLVVAVRLL